MAPGSWLSKVKSAISTGIDSLRSTVIAAGSGGKRGASIGILAFETASVMSKLLHLCRSLSDAQIARLRHETIAQLGVRKIVSDDDAFLLGLACAELSECLRAVADSTSALSRRCADPALREFELAFKKFCDVGHDPHRWIMSWKEMESKARKMDRFIASTAALYKEMDDLAENEHAMRKLLSSAASAAAAGGGGHQSLPMSKMTMISDLQQKIFWQKQEIKYLKKSSLWNSSFDAVVSILARSTFTVLARLKGVFAVGGGEPHPLPRSLSVSAAIHPSADASPPLPPPPPKFVSGPLMLQTPSCKVPSLGFMETSSEKMTPPPSTLGGAALALHYANLIIVLEKMIRSPRAVGAEARDDLYGMLTASVRGQLRSRLRGVGYWGPRAADAGLASEWRAAMSRIVEWLGPMAHATMKWQADRSFERRSAAAPRANVLLLQTLHFASREKVEAAVTELLVGLNYVWRFEREVCASMALMLQQMEESGGGATSCDGQC